MCLCARFIPSSCHPWCVWALLVLVLSFSCFSPSSTSSRPHSTCSVPGTPSSMSTTPRVKTTALTLNEEYCTMAIYHPLTGYEPKLLDDFYYHSETSAMIFQDESSDIDTEPSYSCEAELDDEIIGKALPSPLFIQEREEPANRRQAYHSHEESFLPAQSFSAHSGTERPVNELSSCQKRKPSREMENERIRILFERQKRANSRWSQNRDPEARISSRFWEKKYPGIEWNYWVSAKRDWSYYCRWCTTPTRSTSSSRTTIRTKSGSSWSSYQVFMRWKNWREFRSYESMSLREDDWSKITTLLKLILWMTREILKMLNKYAVDYPTFSVNQHYSHLIMILAGC